MLWGGICLIDTCAKLFLTEAMQHNMKRQQKSVWERGKSVLSDFLDERRYTERQDMMGVDMLLCLQRMFSSCLWQVIQ